MAFYHYYYISVFVRRLTIRGVIQTESLLLCTRNLLIKIAASNVRTDKQHFPFSGLPYKYQFNSQYQLFRLKTDLLHKNPYYNRIKLITVFSHFLPSSHQTEPRSNVHQLYHC